MTTFATLVLCSALFCSGASAQNGARGATPQTQAAAPAATGAVSPQGAQAAQSAGSQNTSTTGSNAARDGRGTRRGGRQSNTAQPGAPANGTTPNGQPGITGVPRYHAGFRGPQDQPAPKATARVVVTGDSDGNGIVNAEANSRLPGVQTARNALNLPAGTPIQVRLSQPIDSGHAKNGDMVPGVLAAPVGQLAAGTPVQLTVVASAAAGRIASQGELSIQVVSINGETVLSDVITAEGKEGPKLLPDDAPGRGTEAILTPDQTITLHAAA